MFQDSVAGRVYVAPGELVRADDLSTVLPPELSERAEIVSGPDELRRIVTEVVDRRVRVFLPAMTGGPERTGDIGYVRGNWRLLSAPVMAAVGVALTGRVPNVGFLVSGDPADEFVESRQALVWISMLADWTNGEGAGTFEEDLTEYVDRSPFLGDPLRFAARLDELPSPDDKMLAGLDAYRREALRASLYARVGEPNPLADRWALSWLWWEVNERVAEGRGLAEVPALAVSAERLRRTVPPDSARFAGAELLNRVSENRSGKGPDLKSVQVALREAFHAAGFDEQLNSIYAGMRLLRRPAKKVAKSLITALKGKTFDTARDLAPLKAMAGALAEAGRANDLKRVAEAMRAAVPAADAADVSVWYYTQLYQMRMPRRLLEEAGEVPAPEEDRLPAVVRAELLHLRTLSLRALGQQADALALLDSAPPEVLAEPEARQRLGIARALLTRELGAPAAALAQLEALLADVDDPLPALHESLMATLLRFGRYGEAAEHGRAAYTGALRDRMTWPVGRFAAQTLCCQAFAGREPDADLIGPAMGENEPADPERDLFAATALLTAGVPDGPRHEFLDRVRSEVDAVLERARAEQDARTAHRALYVAALYDEVYRPDAALDSWVRLLSVMAEEFDVAAVNGYLYAAAHLTAAGDLPVAREALKRELGNTALLGQDGRIGAATLAGGHTAREIDLVTSALFAEPAAVPADLRLAGELRRGVAGRAVRRGSEEQAWRQHGLADHVVAAIAPPTGRVGVLEWVTDGSETRALITVADATGSVATTVVPLPEADLGRAARRLRSRLSTWRAGRAGDPFGVAEWQACRVWLDRLLADHLAEDDHLVVIPFAGWRELPWHAAAFDRVTCSYQPSWTALLSTATSTPTGPLVREGVVAVPRVGDPAEVTDAIARYVAGVGDPARVLDGVAADRQAVAGLLTEVDLATLLTHGYTSAAETEVALMLAADGSLPLAHSVAASSERGRRHRFGWREYAELTKAPQVILSAACGTGGSHIVGLGEHLGLYNVLRQAGLRTLVAPQWDIVAADVIPILGEIRTDLLNGTPLAQSVRQTAREAIDRGVPAWSAHALIIEGDWR